MTREWKPGDVAWVTCSLGKGLAARTSRRYLADKPVWLWLTLDGKPRCDGGFVRDENVTSVRPVEIEAPEPEEPTNFSAAVADGTNVWWARCGTAPSGDWVNADGEHVEWRDLPRPLTVLHDGWDADA